MHCSGCGCPHSPPSSSAVHPPCHPLPVEGRICSPFFAASTMSNDRSLCLQYFFSNAASCKRFTSSARNSNSLKSLHFSSRRMTAVTFSEQMTSRMTHGALLTFPCGRRQFRMLSLIRSVRTPIRGNTGATHQISSVRIATMRCNRATRAFFVLLRRHTTLFRSHDKKIAARNTSSARKHPREH
jgi:hypothetical protein